MTSDPSPFTPDGFQFAWDSTSLKLAEECPRKYQYKMLQKWQSPHIGTDLRFGQIYASALEHFYKHQHAGASREEAIELIVHEALIASWDYDLGPEGERLPGTGRPWSPDHATKDRNTLIRSIVWYFEHFNPDPAEIFTLDDGRPAVEHTFKIEITSNFLLTGHLDRVVTFGGEVYVMDQKTTSSALGPFYFNRFKPDTQMSAYTFAAKTVFNSPISGVLIDAAQIGAGFTRFERAPTHRGPTELDEWLNDMVNLIDQIHTYQRNGYFPMNRSSCHKYSGCEFRDICNRPPSIRETFLSSNYSRREWNPLRSR